MGRTNRRRTNRRWRQLLRSKLGNEALEDLDKQRLAKAVFMTTTSVLTNIATTVLSNLNNITELIQTNNPVLIHTNDSVLINTNSSAHQHPLEVNQQQTQGQTETQGV